MISRTRLLPVALALLLALGACTTLRLDTAPQPQTWAWERPAATALARALRLPDGASSGALPLVAGQDALSVRVSLAERAQHTLDLQYYIVRDDATTRLLMARVLAAARRGVRVRLLVDDLDALGKDLDLSTLAAAGPVQVRLFNPFATRGRFGPGHLLELLADSQRLNRRMHNKLWVADNAIAVVGGRNLGNEYFDAADGVNFSDLDLLLSGAAVPAISASFDAFWNSAWAVPVQALLREPHPSAQALRDFEGALATQERRFRASDYASAWRANEIGPGLVEGQTALAPAEVEVFHDSPSKVDPGADTGSTMPVLAARIQPLLTAARSELLLVSPYLIPSEEGLRALAALVRRGVRVRVLTNSLASAEMLPMGHAGYSRHRAALAQAGVELHELRPASDATPRWRNPARWSGGTLHTKAFVIDRRHVVVGSMNLDPRSRDTNTEIALLLDSLTLGHTLGQLFDEAAHPARSWRVRWTEPADGVPHLRWHAEDRGVSVQIDHEPQAGLWRRALSRLLRAIAPEELL
jgi:putative cardiolipin synthase